MPERPLTIATYAAGASLAAITLVYVFGPTFFLDDEAANSSRSSRKKGVVGLLNPANDCFINSVLQALAGLPELRLYLIREMHRRRLDGPELYMDLTAARAQQAKNKDRKQIPEWKILGLQQGLVTAGLKDVLDALNERPIYKKTISAQGFVRCVELAFRTRISRSQQDAQEFLQVIAERLADEHAAGQTVRAWAQRERHESDVLPQDGETDVLAESQATLVATEGQPSKVAFPDTGTTDTALPLGEAFGKKDSEVGTHAVDQVSTNSSNGADDVSLFPLEGKLESQVECSFCHFKPRPHVSSFVTLTLHVPQNSGATSLNTCFDGMLKVEHIDDFACDRCRLEHALQMNAKQLAASSLSSDQRTILENARHRLRTALHEDPECPPKDVKLPDLVLAPKRRISRHTRIASFPRVLAVHLSRSVWDTSSTSSKNQAKVSFPETLPLGGLLDRKTYRLLGVVTHKGGHNSGHYESFRRQFLSAPYSTPTSMGREGMFSLHATPAGSPHLSAAPSPRLSGRAADSPAGTLPETPTREMMPPSLDSPSGSSVSSRSLANHTLDRQKPAQTSKPPETAALVGLSPPVVHHKSPDSGLARTQSLTSAINRVRQRQRGPDRWWRISDDKIKESKTSDVLGMQREVYLLFYEMVDEHSG